MNDSEINVAIAELCGWKRCETGTDCWINKEGRHTSSGIEFPNYSQDLNAMHEAEKTLDQVEVEKYTDVLCDEVAGCDPDPNIRGLLFLNARQRAEAFLRVKGKWKE